MDKKSSLLPQILRLNTASRFSAAPGANGSKTRLEELWHNCPVAVEPRDNAWAMHLPFKYGWTGPGFRCSYVIQGLPRVWLTWYLNWKVNPDAVTADSRWKQSVVERETQQAADYVLPSFLPSSSPTCSRQLTAYINFMCSVLFMSLAAFTAGFKGAPWQVYLSENASNKRLALRWDGHEHSWISVTPQAALWILTLWIKPLLILSCRKKKIPMHVLFLVWSKTARNSQTPHFRKRQYFSQRIRFSGKHIVHF